MPRSRAYLLLTIAIGLLTLAFYLGLESYMRPYALQGMYFQEWSSETMMQTLSIEDLRHAPLQSLWNLHMQPPLLDTIRAILAHLANANEGVALVREVDQDLYMVWALGAATLAIVMFRWLKQLTNTSLAFLATLLFMIHPGVIFYATLLGERPCHGDGWLMYGVRAGSLRRWFRCLSAANSHAFKIISMCLLIGIPL